MIVPSHITDGVSKIVKDLGNPNYISRSHLEIELIDAGVIQSDPRLEEKYYKRRWKHSGVKNRFMITNAIQRLLVRDGGKFYCYVPLATRKGQRDRAFRKEEVKHA